MIIYITGVWKDYLMKYVGCVVRVDGSKVAMHGEFSGSQVETETYVIGKALEYGFKNNENVTIHTDLLDAIKYATGEWKAISKVTKSFVRFLKKVSNRIEVEIDSEISEDMLNELLSNKLKTNSVSDEVQGFHLTVYNLSSETIFFEVDSNEFSENLENVRKDTIKLADYYEEKGYRVERKNLC